MHHLIQRQIAEHLGEEASIPEAMRPLLDAIGRTYDQFESDRLLLKRSMELSSDDLIEANHNLRTEKAQQEVLLQRLKASLQSLRSNTESEVTEDDLLAVSDHLRDQIALRNNAERLLREREERLRLILDSTKDYAIFAMDPEGLIQTWNDGAARVTGYGEDEVIGRTVTMFYMRDMGPSDLYLTMLEEAARDGSAHAQGWRQRKDGKPFWADVTVAALRDEHGEVVGYVNISRDITLQRRADEALRLAKDQAEAASRAKSQFLASMSHEIRTPINAVIGMTTMLADTSLDAEQSDMVQTIESSSNALLALISDILDLSMIEAGRISVRLDRFDLEAAITNALRVFRPMVDTDAVRLSCDFDSGAPRWILGDETRVRQILFNLIGNAVKFTDSGSICVHVTAEEKPEGYLYQLAVLDTGIGIPAGELPHLFEPFRQVESSRARNLSGTGLGLSISERLVKAMDGSIWVESREGEGTAFYVSLPVSEVYQDDGLAADTAESGMVRASDRPSMQARSGDLAAGDFRILVAEDNPTNQLLIRMLLKRMGYKADMASNGREAAEMAASEPYHLVFMDMHMPEMDGLAATRSIRAHPGDQPYVVALTANAMPADRRACLDAGMDEFLSKPVLGTDLLRIIERCKALDKADSRTRQA